jgi:hypothetical protein
MTVNRSAVSALIPIKDGAKYIKNLKEQLGKTLIPHDEIVLINDGSVDRTWEELQKWSREDSRILLINNTNFGLANALNLGLIAASNNLVARFDIDDKYRGDRITKQVNAMKVNTVAVFSDYLFKSFHGKNLGTIPTAVFPEATSVSLISSQRTPHPVALLNRDAVLSVGGYRQKDFPAEDLSLWLRLSRAGSLESVPENLLEYTINPYGVSSSKRKMQLAKTAEMLEVIGINPPDLGHVTDNFINICESYESVDLPVIRKILLLRELQSAISVRGGEIAIPKTVLLKSVKASDLSDIAKFSLMTIYRKILRTLH